MNFNFNTNSNMVPTTLDTWVQAPLNSVTEDSRYHKSMRQILYRIPQAGEYSYQIQKIIRDAWRQLPADFKPSKMRLSYGWGLEREFGEPEQLPNPYRRAYYTQWDEDTQMPERKVVDLTETGLYASHAMTGADLSLMQNPNGEDGEQLTRVSTLEELMAVGAKHLHDRDVLSEHYAEIAE